MTTTSSTEHRQGFEPITDDDETIARYVRDLSTPALLCTLVHLTGDTSILDGEIRPGAAFINEFQGFLSDEDRERVAEQATAAIIDYRDRGHTLPPPPDEETVHRMMSFIVGTPVPEEYVPLVLEELDLEATDPRRVDWGDVPDEAKAGFPVLVIGCGMSGLLAGIRLGEAGIPYTIVEKNAGTGGTWWENSYPGARVDVGNHFYCYSFEPADHWTEYFSRQPELARYFDDVMHRHGVDRHVRWETEVVRAVWDEPSATWQVEVRKADGSTETLGARALISAVGQLNRPKLPDLEGIDDFEGPAFHSARWDHSVDLAGKRVAMIGAGASGFQIAPTIAPEVGHLTVYQRTAQWMFDNPNYHEPVPEGMKWAIRHLPYFGRWFRFLIFWPSCDGGLIAARCDPEWDDGGVSVSEANLLAREMFVDWFRQQVGDDPELMEKVVPDYPATGKRTLQDNGSWLRTLKRPNVDLVRTPIARITPTGVETTDGVHTEVDVIVFATGFEATKMLWPMDIVGRDGQVLSEVWGDRPSAHLGIGIPGFPNLFCLYGPGTNLATGGSLIFHSECEMRWIEQVLRVLVAEGRRSVEPTEEARDDWFERTQEEMSQMVWSHPSIEHSFYKFPDGKVYGLSPWRLVDFWSWTREPDPADLRFD